MNSIPHENPRIVDLGLVTKARHDAEIAAICGLPQAINEAMSAALLAAMAFTLAFAAAARLAPVVAI